MFGNEAKSQIEYIEVMDSSYSCSFEKNLLTWFSIGNQDDFLTFIVDWGDGNTYESNGNNYIANDSYFVEFSHEYTSPGLYPVFVSTVSNVNGNTVTSSVIQITVNELGHCGNLYPYIYSNNLCNQGNIFISDVLYDLIGADGSIIHFTGNIQNVDINNIPYSIQPNSQWLEEHNFVYSGSPIIINEFDPLYGFPIMNNNFEFIVSNLDIETTPDYYVNNVFGVGISTTETAWLQLSLFDLSCNSSHNTSISITFPNNLVPLTANLNNPTITGNVLTFNYDMSSFLPTVYFSMPGTTPAGSYLDYTINVTDLNGTETNLSNNTVQYSAMVYNSYDPNEKLVNQPEFINPQTQEELTYEVHFQNEGNYPANKVVIVDTLDEDLDLQTFEMIRSKHNVITEFNPNTGVVSFTFNEINLLPKEQDEEGSKGYVVYKIKEKANLAVGTEINNTAYIYFDFNPAIITNTTSNKNSVSHIEETSLETITIHPNPSSGILTITSGKEINSLKVFNQSGKLCFESHTTNLKSINLSSLNDGLYIVELKNKNSLEYKKLIIKK